MRSARLLTEWWFWASLPFVLALMFAIDRLLSNYNRAYWRRRGQEPPPRRSSYVDAGRLVLYTAITGAFSIVELARTEYLWAAVLAGLSVLFGLLTVRRARRNVI